MFRHSCRLDTNGKFGYLCKTLCNSNAKFLQLASAVVIYSHPSISSRLIITVLEGYCKIIFHWVYTS
jgi:hypothetical protein